MKLIFNFKEKEEKSDFNDQFELIDLIGVSGFRSRWMIIITLYVCVLCVSVVCVLFYMFRFEIFFWRFQLSPFFFHSQYPCY